MRATANSSNIELQDFSSADGGGRHSLLRDAEFPAQDGEGPPSELLMKKPSFWRSYFAASRVEWSSWDLSWCRLGSCCSACHLVMVLLTFLSSFALLVMLNRMSNCWTARDELDLLNKYDAQRFEVRARIARAAAAEGLTMPFCILVR